MKRFFSNPLNWLLTAMSILITAFMILVIKIDYSSDIPVEKPIQAKANFNLYPHLMEIDLQQLKTSFPYAIYLDSANLHDINAIRNNLAALDSMNHDNRMLNQEVLSIALTEKLEERIKSSFTSYNPDSLIQIIQWAEKFNSYSEIDQPNAILFQVVYSHWFNFVSNRLQTYYDKEYSIKYNYKFKYLSDRLKEKQFSTPIKGTYLEKTISNLIQKKWSYLFNKFWHATTPLFKLVILFLVLIIFFPYIYIFKRSLKNKPL